MGRKILVVVDMQNDFVDGSLGTAEAVAIVPAVIKKIKEYKATPGAEIIYTMDTHKEDYLQTQEGQNLPVEHCIYPGNGWQLNEQVAAALAELVPAREVQKPTFGAADLGTKISELAAGEPLEQIELVGLCTGICVISNAAVIKASLPEVPITVDASCCACVTPDSHRTALKAMELLQINIIN